MCKSNLYLCVVIKTVAYFAFDTYKNQCEFEKNRKICVITANVCIYICIKDRNNSKMFLVFICMCLNCGIMCNMIEHCLLHFFLFFTGNAGVFIVINFIHMHTLINILM